MSEQPTTSSGESAPQNFGLEAARLAYSIIESLLDHTRVTGDLVALMAQVLDEDTVKALTGTPNWSAYLDSRRALQRTHANIERFTEIMTKLSDDADK
ncbi:MAG: hypothetical protein ABR577_18925 [Pyrinomonadaceae bacterium]